MPDIVLSKDIKVKFLKVKRGIMRRLIENQSQNETLRNWTIPYLKSEILKMSKMERIDLIEYKRMNNLTFYKSTYSPEKNNHLAIV